jgi:hypothetical protein
LDNLAAGFRHPAGAFAKKISEGTKSSQLP